MHNKFLFSLIVFALCTTSSLVGAQGEYVTLASYKTRYGDYGRYHGRAHNIRLATQSIHGSIIRPGEQLSFNDIVGRRTRSNGFRTAPVILSGRMDMDYGGGICQVASTIYAAALYSGLKIIERHPHSRISSYIPPGLDATVNWQTKDLIIENPFSVPVIINAKTYRGRRATEEWVQIDIAAREQVYTVRIRRRQHVLARFETVTVVDAELEPGSQRIVEPGTPKILSVVTRTMDLINPNQLLQRHIVERIETVYQPSNRIIAIGVGEQQSEGTL